MFRLFGRSKDKIHSPKILIAAITSAYSRLILEDRTIYDCFENVEVFETESILEFYKVLENNTFDILHLFVTIASDQTVQGESAVSFFKKLSEANIKIFILACDNEGDNLIPFYSQASNAGYALMNLVMTLDRKGAFFTKFFKSLFIYMVGGKTMPQAWVELAPQNPNIEHEAPETVFSARYGSLKLSV